MTKPIPARDIEEALAKRDPSAARAFRAKVGNDDDPALNALKSQKVRPIPGRVQKIRAVPQITEKRGHMAIHVEVVRKDEKGNGVSISADLDDQLALYEFNRVYEGYMPRKKFLGLF